MFTDKYGVDEAQFLRSHRPLARRLTELEAENETLRQQIAALTPPEGYVLVPVEPTVEMVRAFNGYRPICRASFACRYEEMIAARPEVP